MNPRPSWLFAEKFDVSANLPALRELFSKSAPMNRKSTKETPQDEAVRQSERDEKFLRIMAEHERDVDRYVVSLIFDYSAVDDIVQDIVAVYDRALTKAEVATLCSSSPVACP